MKKKDKKILRVKKEDFKDKVNYQKRIWIFTILFLIIAIGFIVYHNFYSKQEPQFSSEAIPSIPQDLANKILAGIRINEKFTCISTSKSVWGTQICRAINCEKLVYLGCENRTSGKKIEYRTLCGYTTACGVNCSRDDTIFNRMIC